MFKKRASEVHLKTSSLLGHEKNNFWMWKLINTINIKPMISKQEFLHKSLFRLPSWSLLEGMQQDPKMGGLINPRPWRGQYRTGFSNTGGSPKPRKRAPCQKRSKNSPLAFEIQHLLLFIILDVFGLVELANLKALCPRWNRYSFRGRKVWMMVFSVKSACLKDWLFSHLVVCCLLSNSRWKSGHEFLIHDWS